MKKLFRVYSRPEPGELDTYFVIAEDFQDAANKIIQLDVEEVVMVEILGEGGVDGIFSEAS